MATLYKLWTVEDPEADANVRQWFVSRGWSEVTVKTAQDIGRWRAFILEGTPPGYDGSTLAEQLAEK